MPQITEAEVFRACQTLFGSDLNLSHDCLHYQQPSGVRSAYRKMAKANHPDRFALSATSSKGKQQRLFQDLNQAHETVPQFQKQCERLPAASFFRHRSSPEPTQTKRRRQDRSYSKYYRGRFLHQRSHQQQMGHYFIKQSFFEEEMLNHLLNQLAEHKRTYHQGYGGHYYFHYY